MIHKKHFNSNNFLSQLFSRVTLIPLNGERQTKKKQKEKRKAEITTALTKQNY